MDMFLLHRLAAAHAADPHGTYFNHPLSLPSIFDKPYALRDVDTPRSSGDQASQPAQSARPVKSRDSRPSFTSFGMRPTPRAEQQTPSLGQAVEWGWRVVDAPSLTAFKIGGMMMGSPNGVVAGLGALLSLGAFLRGLGKLGEKLDG
jgi:hypothetical protein